MATSFNQVACIKQACIQFRHRQIHLKSNCIKQARLKQAYFAYPLLGACLIQIGLYYTDLKLVYHNRFLVDHLTRLLQNLLDLFQNMATKEWFQYELQHEISNNVVCATSKASDQPRSEHFLYRILIGRFALLRDWMSVSRHGAAGNGF